uniref:Peptidase S74 domain-containing protein n=1 Tax=uncultured bacterium FLS12 TaxID=651659 RepID=C5HLC0_9BACT|nr:hypothetical protein GAU_3428 [uncultured bacterium FLS12]
MPRPSIPRWEAASRTTPGATNRSWPVAGATAPEALSPPSAGVSTTSQKATSPPSAAANTTGPTAYTRRWAAATANNALADFATIAGGGAILGFDGTDSHFVYDNYGTIGGGAGNIAGSDDDDLESDEFATVAGGLLNEASGSYSTIGGGTGNEASGYASSVGGGTNSIANATGATVAGGNSNRATGEGATVAGGWGNFATGEESMVPGGAVNNAIGDHSFAAGFYAQADHDGAFVWADNNSVRFTSDHANQFKVRATGGVLTEDNGGSHGLHPAAVKVVSTSSDGVALYATQSSTDATLVVFNHGTGDIIRGFGIGGSNMRFRVNQQGDVSCDGTFKSGGADFAEYLPKRDAARALEPGDVVGVFADGVSRDTHGAERVLVITTKPLLLGNAPDDADRSNYAAVAMLGQVPVKARGPVAAGDYLVASGAHDGTAVALPASAIEVGHLARIVGCALESSSHDGVHSVMASVGFSRDRLWAQALSERDARVATLERELEALKAAVNALASR